MKSIWKFPLRIDDSQEIRLPKSSSILCVQNQAGVICLWAYVDTKQETVGRMIRIFGTGHAIPENEELRYIGSAQQGQFVWHVFEEVA